MDFHSLSRRELQALCKRNKIPANVSNAAMADSLKALEIVEGIDDVLQACKSEISQSSTEPQARLEVTSPYVPPTGGRSTRQKDVLLTPAQSGVTSRRRRAAKEDSSAVKQVYGTRRSARLAEKSAKLLKGVTEFSKKDLFTGDGQDLQMNLEESLDGSDEMSGVTSTEESERRDEGQVESGNKQDVSTDVELAPATEEEVRTHFEKDGAQFKLNEGVDANTSVVVNFEAKDESKAEDVEVPKIEEEHHYYTVDANIELNESRVAEIEQVGSGSETEDFFNCDDTKASHDETRALALNMNYESQKTDVLDAVQTQLTRIKAENIEEENKDDLAIVEVSSDTVSPNPDESVSVILACTPSEISLMSNEDDAFNWNEEIETVQPVTYVTAKQGDPLSISLENSQTHQLSAVAPNNIGTASMENAPSKASARMTRVTAADTDNKENISKDVPAKERLKIFKDIDETVHMLDDTNLMKLSKTMKELAITQNLDKNEGENGASARTALQALPDN